MVLSISRTLASMDRHEAKCPEPNAEESSVRLEKISIATLPSGEQRLSGFVRYDDGQTEEYWFTAPADLKISNSGVILAGGSAALCGLHRAGSRTGCSRRSVSLEQRGMPAEFVAGMAWGESQEDHHPSGGGSDRGAADEGAFDVHRRRGRLLYGLRHAECKHFVNVLGMDMPLGNREAYGRLLARLVESAKELGARMIPMATNLRETRWKKIPWEDFASGGALCGTFLVLEREFNTILVPSSFDFRTLFPWGTHPLSDPLYSTSRTQIVHDGTSHSRVEKTLAIAHHPTVLKNLHVCFQGHDAHGQDDTNCCSCSKCYRTMTVFEILGKLKDCRLFDYRKFHVAKIARLDSTSPVTQSFFNDIRDLALKHGRLEHRRQHRPKF